MNIYTFVTDFKGGTYLAQVLAPDVERAMATWAEQLVESDLGGLGTHLEQARAELSREGLVPVTGLHAVWCGSINVKDDLLLVHIIEGRTKPVDLPN